MSFCVKYTIVLCLALICPFLAAQEILSTQRNIGTESLVKSDLIKGNCRNVTNISSLGSPNMSIGLFANGESTIGIPKGILITTGAVQLARGPNSSGDASSTVSTISQNDEDLDQLATSELFDVTGIEFDFVPLSESVSFTYVFASEEYCEFVGTTFNDVFGFFVCGPGINGSFENNAINVATLTNSDEIVSINSVNHLENEQFYVDNVTNLDAGACGIDASPVAEDYIEYDGYTIPLVASFSVIPCETYHIRLVIGDVGDSNLDSAVFIEANSFDLGEQVNLFAEVPNSTEPIAYEGCIDPQFVFTRSSLNNLNKEVTVNYSISPDSEAVNGVDFTEIPLSITIPPGDTSFILPIEIINDGIVEGPERLQLDIPYDCDCIDPVLNQIIINDPTSLVTNFNEVRVCQGQEFNIEPNILEGAAPFSYLWEDGSEGNNFETSVVNPTEISVVITDNCGHTDLAIAEIQLQPIPSANLTGIYDLCEVSATGIPVQIEGEPPFTLTYSIDEMAQTTIENINSNIIYIEAPRDGIYKLLALHNSRCEGIVLGCAQVESTFDIEISIVAPSCFNKSDGKIEITRLDTTNLVSIQWSIESQNDFMLEGLGEGTYILTVIDSNGCTYEEIVQLTSDNQDISECISIYIPNILNPALVGENNAFRLYYGEESDISTILSIQIYDRWGSVLFDESNIEPVSGIQLWEGTYNNETVSPGIYVYKILLELEDGSQYIMNGDISLIK